MVCEYNLTSIIINSLILLLFCGVFYNLVRWWKHSSFQKKSDWFNAFPEFFQKIVLLLLGVILLTIYIHLVVKGFALLVKSIGMLNNCGIIVMLLVFLLALIAFVIVTFWFMCYFKRISFTKYLNKVSKLIFFNSYLRVSLALILLVLAIGIQALNISLANDLPLSINWTTRNQTSSLLDNQLNITNKSICQSSHNFFYFVKEDTLKCDFQINYFGSDSLSLSINRNNSSSISYIQPGSKSYPFDIEVSLKDISKVKVNAVISETTSGITVYSSEADLFLPTISLKEHTERQRYKLIWLISLFIGSITVVFGIVSKAKELLKFDS